MDPSHLPPVPLPPGPAAASLAAVRHAARRRRIRRRTGRAAAILTLITAAAGLPLLRDSPSPSSPALTREQPPGTKPDPAFVTVRTQPLPAPPEIPAGFVRITTSPPPASAPIVRTAPVLISTASSPPVVRARDEDLLASAGDRPIALCRLADGAVKWMPLNPPIFRNPGVPAPADSYLNP